jgi:hypothetical protein
MKEPLRFTRSIWVGGAVLRQRLVCLAPIIIGLAIVFREAVTCLTDMRREQRKSLQLLAF